MALLYELDAFPFVLENRKTAILLEGDTELTAMNGVLTDQACPN